MNQTNFLGKFTSHLFQFLLISSVFFFNSCNDATTSTELKGSDSTKQGTVTGATLAPITGKLNVLYLENYVDGTDSSHAQLGKLLAMVAGHRKDKLICHSFHDSANAMTYGVWPCDNGNKKFDYNEVQVLKVSSEELGDPIDGREFYFGDQQLIARDIVVLKRLINDTTARYVLFKPVISLKTDEFSNNSSHLSYELYKSRTLTGFVSVFKDPNNRITYTAATGEILIGTNPSPPATAN